MSNKGTVLQPHKIEVIQESSPIFEHMYLPWQRRAVAREIMSGIAVEEFQERLWDFLEHKSVASLSLGDHRTGTLRVIEARTLTEYLTRLIESRGQKEYRHSINLAAKGHHARLMNDFEKAKDYFATARELASEAQGSKPQFTDRKGSTWRFT
jgi:hypothetical protein